MHGLRSRAIRLALSLLLSLQGCVAMMAAGAIAGGVEGTRTSQHHKVG